MRFTNDYIEDLMARMAYHSNALENREITLAETVSVILYNTVPPKMSLHNLYAIDNHKYAVAFLLKQDQDDLSIAIMTEIHTILTYRLQENQKYWDQIHKPMELLIEETNKQLHSAKHEDEVIEIACAFHIEFMQANDFENGSTGRLLMNYLLIQHEVAPIVIRKEDENYYDSLISHKDLQALFTYAKEQIQSENNRIQYFTNDGGNDDGN